MTAQESLAAGRHPQKFEPDAGAKVELHQSCARKGYTKGGVPVPKAGAGDSHLRICQVRLRCHGKKDLNGWRN
jgi:hypothetical protein